LKYDYIIVGAGLYGCTMARLLTDAGKKVLVIEKRYHIGGNCASEIIDGMDCHKYGPHVFHTNDFNIIKWLAQFDEFTDFNPVNYIKYKEKLYNIPINLKTIEDVLADRKKITPREAKELVKLHCIKTEEKNIESWCFANIGKCLYYTCVYGYTKKMWGRDPSSLPAEIIKRLPIRYNYKSEYHEDKYSMIPVNGWNTVFENMLKDIPYILGFDFLKHDVSMMTDKIIYTGPIDKYFGYKYGDLSWRSLDFKIKRLDVDDYQGNAIIHYGDEDTIYTRSVEYKHFNGGPVGRTVVIYEIPKEDRNNPFYPVNSENDKKIYAQYKKLADEEENVFFGGRLAEYKYYNMDTIIEKAMKDFEQCI
jgi:UDP-galactopyranose mutase